MKNPLPSTPWRFPVFCCSRGLRCQPDRQEHQGGRRHSAWGAPRSSIQHRRWAVPSRLRCRDLNLVKADIPPQLAAARQTPYRPADRPQLPRRWQSSAVTGCGAGGRSGHPFHLNQLIWWAGVRARRRRGYRRREEAQQRLWCQRSWVHWLTGAEKYSREGASLHHSGHHRRSYLQGGWGRLGCGSPAARLG